jgi:hypothetical protein
MGLHLEPNDWQPLDEGRTIRVTDVGEERQITREGVQYLAHGAMICPACALPIALAGRTPVATEIRCGFCAHEAKAREFVARDVFDTVSNEVYIVARVA